MKFWQILILIVVVAILGVGISVWQPWKTASRTIQVSAEGKIKAIPDVSKITAGVEITKATSDEAQKEASTKISAIIDVIKAKGVAEKDIQTQSISVNPAYDYSASYSNNTPKISGYIGSGVITITVRDVNIAQEIVVAATSGGATTVYGPQLTFSDEKLVEIKEQAQTEAVKNARAKADNLAKASGVKVGKVVMISESDLSGRYYPMMDSAAAVSTAGSTKSVNSIQPGENDISVTVNVTFGLK